MAQTSNSSDSPYLTAREMFLCYSPSIVADMLRPKTVPNAPPPSYLAMCDLTNPAGAALWFHLKIGAGEIESACAIAKRYTPLDLAALTGVSQVLLKKLNAARGMWSMCHQLQPLTANPDNVPMALESMELLKELRDGMKIFTFEETQAAGLPSVVPPNPAALVTGNVISRAARLFPNSPMSGWGRRGGSSGGD
jgi:hypothetical protein